MLDVVLKRFEAPDETRRFEKGKFEIVRIGGVTIGRATYEPGWCWSEHVGRDLGQPRCPVEHVGLVLAGVATVAFEDGRVIEGSARRSFDYGRLRLDYFADTGGWVDPSLAKRMANWGPGRADVTEDDDEDPVSIPDLWSIRDQRWLTQAGTIRHESPLALATRRSRRFARDKTVRPRRANVRAALRADHSRACGARECLRRTSTALRSVLGPTLTGGLRVVKRSGSPRSELCYATSDLRASRETPWKDRRSTVLSTRRRTHSAGRLAIV